MDLGVCRGFFETMHFRNEKYVVSYLKGIFVHKPALKVNGKPFTGDVLADRLLSARSRSSIRGNGHNQGHSGVMSVSN